MAKNLLHFIIQFLIPIIILLIVVNNIEIKGWNQFAIITGANMSGKSTFLRTIGANYILAMAGAPVCASKLSFYPIQIHSSIRTSDSLVKHESYFYAELKRLKQIIDELESGKKKLILLDEPTEGLMPLLVRLISETVKAINGKGTAILLVEQNLKTLKDICDRIYIMEKGAVVYSGTPAEIEAAPEIQERYLSVKV